MRDVAHEEGIAVAILRSPRGSEPTDGSDDHGVPWNDSYADLVMKLEIIECLLDVTTDGG